MRVRHNFFDQFNCFVAGGDNKKKEGGKKELA